MRHVRDVMRLRAAGLSIREIGRRVGAVPSTVRLTIRRLEAMYDHIYIDEVHFLQVQHDL